MLIAVGLTGGTLYGVFQRPKEMARLRPLGRRAVLIRAMWQMPLLTCVTLLGVATWLTGPIPAIPGAVIVFLAMAKLQAYFYAAGAALLGGRYWSLNDKAPH
jgi:Na+/H+-dicarboxylate symporter